MRSVVVGLVIVLLASGVAVAQPAKIKAEAASRDGQQRYQAGEYLLAAERFELAYSLDPDPAYLFNLAQAYRLGNACAKAAAAYRKLLSVVSASPNLAKVQQYIEQTDACAKTQAAETPPPPPTPTPTPTPVPTPVASPPPVSPPHHDGKPVLRYAGLGVGVLGLAAVAVGVVSAKKVGDLESEREALCSAGCVWEDTRKRAARLDSDGKRYERRMAIGFIGGGVAIAGGIAMYVLGMDRGAEPSPVAIVPTDGGAMAFGTLRF